MVVSFAFAIALFFVAAGRRRRRPPSACWAWTTDGLTLIEGVTRLGLLLAYLWAVGRMAEIRRVFAYHGAEHKTINAFEAGAPLTVESVAALSARAHPLRHRVPADAGDLLRHPVQPAPADVVRPAHGQPRARHPAAGDAGVRVHPADGALRSSKPWMKPLIAPNLALQNG